MQTIPRDAYRISTVDVQNYAAGVAFMREVTRLRFEHDRISDFGCNALRVVDRSRQCTSGDRDAQSFEQFLASILGDDPRRQVDLKRLDTLDRLATELRQTTECAKRALG